MREWVAHNRLYDFYTAIDNKEKIYSTQHVDLNTDESKLNRFVFYFIAA